MKKFLGGCAFAGGFLFVLMGTRAGTLRAAGGKLDWLADILEQSDDERDLRLAKMIGDELRAVKPDGETTDA